MPGERCSSRSAGGSGGNPSSSPSTHQFSGSVQRSIIVTAAPWFTAILMPVGLMADYNLSKRTDVYLQAAYQHIAGDKTNSILDQAFIPGTDAPSSAANQVAVRVALRHKF